MYINSPNTVVEDNGCKKFLDSKMSTFATEVSTGVAGIVEYTIITIIVHVRNLIMHKYT